MSTYEFQISITPDNYQAESPLIDQNISHRAAHNVVAGPSAMETPEPVIIHYNANQQRPPPYGSGEDGFNMSFANLNAFLAWRAAEESKKYDVPYI